MMPPQDDTNRKKKKHWIRSKRSPPYSCLKAGFMCPWKSLTWLLRLQGIQSDSEIKKQIICKVSIYIIIYGAQEPVSPRQDPLPIEKWRSPREEVRDHGGKNVCGRKYFYMLISGSCLAWWCICFQSGMSLWTPYLERGHVVQELSMLSPCPSHGSSCTVGLENILQLVWAIFVWHLSQKHICVSVSMYALHGGLFSFKLFSLGCLDCRSFWGIVDAL